MSNSAPLTSFHRAQYDGDPPPPDSCAYCSRGLANEYFRVNHHLACAGCAQQAEALVPPDSHRAYSKALLFGALAALAGCIGYALFGIVTGITLGWAAVGVGWLVGWAMKKGSGGLGGRRYQVTAALLTYAAVAVAFVPMALAAKDKGAQPKAAATQSTGERTEAAAAGNADAKAAQATGSAPSAEAKHGFGAFVLGVAMLLGLGLVSPFLILFSSVGSGLLNLFILYLGVSYAWRQTAGARPQVEGPFAT